MFGYAEGRAALAAAKRAGRLTADGYGLVVADFESVWGRLTTIGVDLELARAGGSLAEQLGLRGYDAIHLATALSLGDRAVLVTWDRDLSTAARESGLAIAPATII